jgi:hypothetical protein
MPTLTVSLAEFYLLRLCFDVILQMCHLSPFWIESFLRSASLGQDVVSDSSSIPTSTKYFYSLSFTQTLYLNSKLKW